MLDKQGIFLITQNEDLAGLDNDDYSDFSTDCAVQMHICQSTDDADAVLENISVMNVDTDNCRAYTGAVFSIKEIPKNIKGLTPYLIIDAAASGASHLDLMEGVFKELPKDMDKVCDIIAAALTTKVRIELDDGYVHEDYPDVDMMYLFVGKSTDLSLAMNPDAIDEELLDRIDSICSAVDKGNSYGIYEHSTSNSGDKQMSTNNVILTVNHAEDAGFGEHSTFKVEGRLLGMCITEEALKIAQNSEIARKIHTSPSTHLADAVRHIVKQVEANQSALKPDRKTCHLVIAVKETKNLGTQAVSWPSTRKLYFSPPIELVSGSSDSVTMSSATFECAGGTMCSAMEKLGVGV